jgi:hypothetical protein
VAHMGEERKLFKVLVESPKERDHSEDQGVDQAPPWRVAGLLCFLLFRGNRSTVTWNVRVSSCSTQTQSSMSEQERIGEN